MTVISLVSARSTPKHPTVVIKAEYGDPGVGEPGGIALLRTSVATPGLSYEQTKEAFAELKQHMREHLADMKREERKVA